MVEETGQLGKPCHEHFQTHAHTNHFEAIGHRCRIPYDIYPEMSNIFLKPKSLGG